MSAIHETNPHSFSHPRVADLLADPADVLNHPLMTVDEKRRLLSSWASDSRAVDSDPTLRQLPIGALVPIADILAALRALPVEERPAQPTQAAPRRKVPPFVSWHRRRRRARGDWPGGDAPALALHPAPGLSG